MGWTPQEKALEDRDLRKHSLKVWFMCNLVTVLTKEPSVMLSSTLKC